MEVGFERGYRHRLDLGSVRPEAEEALSLLSKLDTLVNALGRFYEDDRVLAMAGALMRWVAPGYLLVPSFGAVFIEGEGGRVGYCRLGVCYSSTELPSDFAPRLVDAVFTFIILVLDTLPGEAVSVYPQLVETLARAAESMAGAGANMDADLYKLLLKVTELVKTRTYEVEVPQRLRDLVDELTRQTGGGYAHFERGYAADDHYVLIDASVEAGLGLKSLCIGLYPRLRSEVSGVRACATQCRGDALCVRVSLRVDPGAPTKSIGEYVSNIESFSLGWASVASEALRKTLSGARLTGVDRTLVEMGLAVVELLSTSSSRP